MAWHGDADVKRKWRWTLAIPLHLEVVDPIIHARQGPGILHLKLPESLKDRTVLNFAWLRLTAWDVAYVAIEVFWWAVYVGIFCAGLTIARWIR